MTSILEIDKLQRKLTSLGFRLVLILYAIILLKYFNSKMALYINLLVFFGYMAIYLFLFMKDSWLTIVRCFNDYAFITFILFQIKTFDIFGISLLLAPILNSHNHSGNKKSILLYVFPIVSLYILNVEIDTFIIFPFLLFLLINYFYTIREKYVKFQQELNSVVDNYFVSTNSTDKLYRIYKEIITLLNGTNIFKQAITKIFCFKIEDNKISIINGSDFIWSLDFKNRDEIILETAKKTYLFNKEIIVDEQKIDNNLILVCNLESGTYCFTILSDKRFKNYFIRSLILVRLLKPFIHRISKVLDSNYKYKKQQLKKLQELEEKINYVTNAANSMHFIRNKLGPIKSYLAMVADYKNSSDIKKKSKIEPYLDKEREKLSSAMEQILQRADYILKKSNNPFNVVKVDRFGVQQLFSETRRIWGYYFNVEYFNNEWISSSNQKRYEVEYNSIGMELVLSNWISNIERYHTGEYGITFTEDKNNYFITFLNSFDNTSTNSIKFIEEFNTADRAEIARRNSHGLLEIKDFLSQMNIPVKLHHENTTVFFELKLKKFEYESADN